MVTVNVFASGAFGVKLLKITGLKTPGDSGSMHAGTRPVLYSKEIYSVFLLYSEGSKYKE